MSQITQTLRASSILRPVRYHVGRTILNCMYHNGKPMIPPHRLHRLLRRPGLMTWSQVNTVRTQCRLLHESSQASCEQDHRDHTRIPEQWQTELILNEPEFDLDFILDPSNYQLIKDNIAHRKGVGNIDTVLNLHRKMTEENNPEEKEKIYREFIQAAWDLPNMSHPDSPIGDEDQATLLDVVGQKSDMNFEPKDMVELGEQLGMLRTQNTTMSTGHTTYYFIDQLALLEQALIQYTLKYLLEKGFELISVPDLLDPRVIESCGFKTTGNITQVYRLDPRRHANLCLAGTSEMSIAGYFVNKVLERKELPVRYAAVSRCYRAEVAKEEPGIYRVHQFTKVEMFGVTSNDSSSDGNDLLQEFIDIEKHLFSGLGIHYRVLDMPTTELGAPAHRKFDIEAWMPAHRFWGEISSASNCTDYQSRRLNIKYQSDHHTLKHCTTVNGTACAIPRTIMTLCENNQLEMPSNCSKMCNLGNCSDLTLSDSVPCFYVSAVDGFLAHLSHSDRDGSVALPKVLWQYMDGQEKITKSNKLPITRYIDVHSINYKH